MSKRKWTATIDCPNRCGNSIKEGEECAYCNWKGTTGPGKLLREIVKAEREKRDDAVSD